MGYIMRKIKSLKKHLLLPFLLSLLIGGAAALAALILNSLIMYLFQLPVEWGYFLGLLTLSVGCFAGSFALGRRKKRNGIKQGLLCSGGFLLIVLVFGLILGDVSFGGFLLKGFVCNLAGIMGGVIGVN